MISDALVGGFVFCFFTRTSIGSKQRSMCLSRPPIIPSWLACTPVFRQKAGGTLCYPGLLLLSQYSAAIVCLFTSDLFLFCRLFFVIEYVNGGDLMFHMQRQRKLPEEHARWRSALELFLSSNVAQFHACVFQPSSVSV